MCTTLANLYSNRMELPEDGVAFPIRETENGIHTDHLYGDVSVSERFCPTPIELHDRAVP